MAIVRYVLAKRKPGVSPEEYEQAEREGRLRRGRAVPSALDA